MVFVCRGRGIFDGGGVILKWKWWFSCGDGGRIESLFSVFVEDYIFNGPFSFLISGAGEVYFSRSKNFAEKIH